MVNYKNRTFEYARKKIAPIILATIFTTSCGMRENLESKIAKQSDNLAIAEYIASNEGRRSTVYDPIPNDNKKEPTIGVGHYLDRPDSKDVFSRVLPNVNYNEVYNGKQSLTKEQIDILFKEDLKEYFSRTKKAVPKFDEYPTYLKCAILDGFYRGDLSGSPKTLRLINQGSFEDAAKEYLNHSEYKNAKKNGKSGIVKRMNKNRDAFLKYSQEKSSK